MNSVERRKIIVDILNKSTEPQKGSNLANEFSVTRQVIVKDIAILRAEGKNIIATPEGYIIPVNQKQIIRKVLAVSHGPKEIEEELKIIVKFGGIVEDVIIEHPVYGELRGNLMIKSIHDLENFMVKFNNYKAEPLSMLTGGVHLHTVIVENEDTINNIINELKIKGYLISD